MEIPAFIWLVVLPLAASPFVYLAGHAGKRLAQPKAAQAAGLIVLLAAWGPFVLAARELIASPGASFTLETISMQLDGLGLLLAAVALTLGTLTVLYSGPYLAAEAGQEKFYAMLVVMVGVMTGLGFAGDLFNLWIWFEAMAVSSYLLVAFYRELPNSLEAGFKYLVQNAAGSVLVLIGIGLVFTQTGTLNLSEIRAAAQPSPMMLAAGALFVIGFGVKTALVPMHTWLPDAHSQAPSGISAMLSGVVIEAGLIAMLRALGALSGTTHSWGILLMTFGAVNMVVGNLMAFRQVQVKRMLAYSSLTHVGYMLIGLGVSVYAGGAAGAQGSLFHLINHGLMKGLAFLAAGALLYGLHISIGNHAPLTIADLSGGASRYPLAALTLSLALLGLGGIPPLAGFMSKWQIFVAGMQSHNLVIEGLIIFAALNSVFSLAYYAPLINALYRKEQSLAVRIGAPLPGIMNVPLVLLAVSVIALGIWPGLMTWLTGPASAALLSAFSL